MTTNTDRFMTDDAIQSAISTPPSRLPPQIQDAASVGSIVSLLVSLYVAIKVRSIAKHYRGLVLIPAVTKQVSGHIKNVEQQTKSKDWAGLRKESAKVSAAAQHVVGVTSSYAKNSAKKCKKAAQAVTAVNSDTFHSEEAEKLVLSLTDLEAHLKNTIETTKWR